jgi:hypothetical protein
MQKFSIEINYSDGSKRYYPINAISRFTAVRHAHNKALKYTRLIRSIFVRDSQGMLVGGFSRRYGNLKSTFSKVY